MWSTSETVNGRMLSRRQDAVMQLSLERTLSLSSTTAGSSYRCKFYAIAIQAQKNSAAMAMGDWGVKSGPALAAKMTPE